MSESEKRQLRAMALLEVAEAQEHLALLRVKAERWSMLAQGVCHLLARSKRDGAAMEAAAAEQRSRVERDREETVAMLDLDAVLALDTELSDAVDRLKAAIKQRDSLGLRG